MLILLASLLFADEVSDTPAPEPELVTSVPPPQAVDVDVFADPAVARARAQLYQNLKDLGYRKGEHQGDRTVFKSYTPYQPRVIVHDDGWVTLKREPPRVHSPGKSFADQGAPTNYLWCLIAPTACVSVGGWMVGPRKYKGMQGDVLDALHPDVRKLNEAVARRYLENRINNDIPADCDRIWADDIPVEARRELLYTYWDTRLDTPEGDAARLAVMAFIKGVVMQSATPFTDDEIIAMNQRRSCAMVFDPRLYREAP